jgi:hypothetical protein
LEPIYAKLNTYLQGYVFAMSLKELNETILSKISKIDRIAVTFKED